MPAAKKTVYTSHTSSTHTVKRQDVEELKRALRKVFREYRSLRNLESRFNTAVGELAALSIKWTIPKKELDWLFKR